jgi:hypothetical protein
VFIVLLTLFNTFLFLILGNLAHSASVSSDISNRTKMDIVCVIDVVQTCNLAHRKRALEEVKQASMMVNANLFIVSVLLLFYTTCAFVFIKINVFINKFSLKN